MVILSVSSIELLSNGMNPLLWLSLLTIDSHLGGRRFALDATTWLSMVVGFSLQRR